MSKRQPVASKALTEHIEAVVVERRAAISADPGLQSLLYDVDLLPEQLLHVLRVNPPAAELNARRMVAICILWAKQATGVAP